MSSSIVELLGAERKNGLVNADSYRQLDRRCYRSRCAFNGRDLTALGREYDTDGHCSLPTALARRYADGTCGG